MRVHPSGTDAGWLVVSVSGQDCAPVRYSIAESTNFLVGYLVLAVIAFGCAVVVGAVMLGRHPVRGQPATALVL
jgi:hypothetical protein